MLHGAPRSGTIRYVGLTLGLTAIGLGLTWLVAWLGYGSMAAALARFEEGAIVIVEPVAALAVEEGQAYDVPFDLLNGAGRPVRILGCHATCSCTTAQPLPAAVSPGSRTTVRFRYTPSIGELEPVRLILFTDDPRKPELAMTIIPRLKGREMPATGAGQGPP